MKGLVMLLFDERETSSLESMFMIIFIFESFENDTIILKLH